MHQNAGLVFYSPQKTGTNMFLQRNSILLKCDRLITLLLAFGFFSFTDRALTAAGLLQGTLYTRESYGTIYEIVNSL